MNNFSSFGLRGINLPVSNGLFLRILNNGAALNLYYSARLVPNATVVGSVQSVANGAGQDFQPPVGQTWLVGCAYSTSGNLTFTDGMIDTGVSFAIRTVDAFEGWFGMENARYLRYNNTSGSAQTAAVVGILKP